jgi:hypothetical protein
MLFVGIFDFGLVDNMMTGSNQGEVDDGGQGDAKGVADGDPDRACLKLKRELVVCWFSFEPSRT